MENFIFNGRVIRSVGFFGLGKSSIGVMSYLLSHYCDLEFTLRQDKPIALGDTHLEHDFHKTYIGKSSLDEPCEDLLFISPTVRRDRIAPFFGDRICTDAEFFFDRAPYPIFSVTGSDGKSTTATLSSLLISYGGVRAPAIGNIGVAMTPMLDAKNDYAVAELSSFQLMDFSPRSRRAYITNISPNHLDFHSSMEEYIAAKARIFERAEECVVNLDDDTSLSLAPKDKIYAAVSESMTFDEAKKRVCAELYVTFYNGHILHNGEPIFDTSAMRCKGRYTKLNLAAAIALTDGYTTPDRIRQVGHGFRGLPHRCELVGEFCGIKYFNSSIDSTPKRTATTLASFDGKPIVILGGKSKGLSYSELAPAIKDHASAAIITGANADEIKNALTLGNVEVPVYCEGDFNDAVMTAVRIARRGDSVLLSPASTSFDTFRDFAERGNKFKKIITDFYYKGQ